MTISLPGETAQPFPCSTHHQTSTALLWRKAVALMGTGILIIIPCTPGETSIWEFQRTYPFPALCLMHKPYNITAMQVRELRCACWVPRRANTSTKWTRGTFVWSYWVLCTMGRQGVFFEPCSSRQVGLKFWSTSYRRHSTEYQHSGAKMPFLRRQHNHAWHTAVQNGTNLLQQLYWGPIHHCWPPTALI